MTSPKHQNQNHMEKFTLKLKVLLKPKNKIFMGNVLRQNNRSLNNVIK